MTLTQKARSGFSSVILRGGRVTKWKGQTASYAPHVGAVMTSASGSALAVSLALAGAFLIADPAQAGTCIESAPGSGIWTCSGPAGADSTQVAGTPVGQPLSVTTAAGFGIDTSAGSGGTAIVLNTPVGGGGLTFVDNNNSTIIGGFHGILGIHNGSGASVITSTGSASGGVGGNGISSSNTANGTTLTVTANNASGGVSGIFTRSLGSGGATINLSGTAQGGTGAAIDTISAAGGPGCTAASCLTTINLGAASQTLAGSSGIAIRNNTGNSVLNADSGAVITGEVRLGDGNDIANLSGANVLNGITVLDGGDDAGTGDGMIDVLTLNGVSASINGTTILNWETLSFVNSTITGTGLASNQVNVCGGSTTLTSSVIGAGGVMGCVANDSITLDGTTTVAGSVQGAGGSDTISVLGSASVAGGVYGGSAGQDASAAADTGDMITINTTGTVSLVDGQLGDDTLNLNGGTITGNASGGDGNDAINLAGATVGGTIDGGTGNDLVTMTAGSAGSVLGGDGNDTVNWNAAAATTPLVSMGDGSDVVNINSAAIDLTSVTLNGGDDVLTADGWTDTLNLNAAWSGNLNGANTTNWEVININGGTVGFSNAAITTGVINVNGGGTLNASNNLAVTGNVAISSGSRMVVGTNGGTGLATISGNLTNSGTLDFRSMTGTSATGDRLTVGGNYTGASGSVIHFDTVLGGSNATDLMVVNGNLGGFSAVTVHNVGGTGSLTTGDGIRLVQVDGTSLTTGLALSSGPIDVGAFRYQLYNGGLANPADQDWYLRSGVRDIVPPTIGVARVAQDAGRTALGTLHERVGEQEHYGKLANLNEGYFKGMWGRALGSDYSETGKSAAFGDSRSNGKFGGLQMGIDFYRGITDGGSRIHIGGYAGHLWSKTDDFTVTPIHRGPVGTTRSDGWMAGGYLTYYTPSGFYLDAVVQGDWLDHRLNAVDGTSGQTSSRGLLASIEMGKSFGSNWKFEPQVQVIYGDTKVDGFTDSAGVANRIDIDDSWTGRAGFRLKRTWDYDQNSAGGLFTFYGKANIWGRLDGGTTTLTVGVSNPGTIEYKGVWGDIGLGTTFSIGKGAEFFADADVEYGLDQGATALSGRAGFRIRW